MKFITNIIRNSIRSLESGCDLDKPHDGADVIRWIHNGSFIDNSERAVVNVDVGG